MKPRLPVRSTILARQTFEAAAEGRRNKIRLDFNENTAGCSPAVIRSLAKISPQQVAMYPEYQQSTKRLAKFFNVRPEELLLTNGGDDALRVFFDTFVDPGSSILICVPTFPMYRYWAEIAGAQVHALRYGPEMEFPLAGVIASLQQKPRVLFIANPNNPTGTLVPIAALKTILDSATDTAVVIDEAYAEFCDQTMATEIAAYPHLFITRTFSKAAGLAALRLGAVIANANSLAYLRRAMPPFPVNVAALVAAEAAIADKKTISAYVRHICKRREWLEHELAAIDVKTYPSAANFLLADFGPHSRKIFTALERKNILIRERPDCGPGCARITIGTKKEMDLLMKTIKSSKRP